MFQNGFNVQCRFFNTPVVSPDAVTVVVFVVVVVVVLVVIVVGAVDVIVVVVVGIAIVIAHVILLSYIKDKIFAALQWLAVIISIFW